MVAGLEVDFGDLCRIVKRVVGRFVRNFDAVGLDWGNLYMIQPFVHKLGAGSGLVLDLCRAVVNFERMSVAAADFEQD